MCHSLPETITRGKDNYEKYFLVNNMLLWFHGKQHACTINRHRLNNLQKKTIKARLSCRPGIIPFEHFNWLMKITWVSFVLFSKQILSNCLTIATAIYEFDHLISMDSGAELCARSINNITILKFYCNIKVN